MAETTTISFRRDFAASAFLSILARRGSMKHALSPFAFCTTFLEAKVGRIKSQVPRKRSAMFLHVEVHLCESDC